MQPDDYYNYDLVGVLVHRGVAESGHYYSFIKVRNGDNSQWLEFNDELVRPFDVESLDKECFGGTEQIGDSKYHQRDIPRTRNAYLLIYERKDALILDNIKEEEEEEKKENFIVSQKPVENFPVLVPKKLYENVWEENEKFLMDKRVFETEYAQFCCELAKTYVLEENNDYEILSGDELLPVRVLMSFFFEILLHSKEKGIMIGYCHNIIVNFLSKSVPACRWFLSICTRDSLKRWLLECTEDEARGYAVEVICSAITKVLPLEQELLQNNEGDCSRICDIMLSFVKQLPHYWRTFKQFFIFFEKWVLQGSIERDYLVKRDFIKYTSNLIEYGTVDRVC